jgi:hypothetical protein
MKHYKLVAWPDLPAHFHRTAYRRMLHRMSQRYVSVTQLMQESGLGRHAVMQFLDTLSERELLTSRELASEPDSLFGQLRPLEWFRRTFGTEGRA